ncbi:MAG: hypothetical protein ACM3TN_12350 [Alphaproteobacteria bacterium]
MDIIGESVMEFFRELSPLIDWASHDWAATMIFILLGMICWARHQRRYRKHRF